MPDQPFDASLVRRFEDGVAVFDPVTWQTHVLSRDGFELLLQMVELARVGDVSPADILTVMAADAAADQDVTQLTPWAQLACHLGAPPLGA